jgi:hypothetical protein
MTHGFKVGAASRTFSSQWAFMTVSIIQALAELSRRWRWASRVAYLRPGDLSRIRNKIACHSHLGDYDGLGDIRLNALPPEENMAHVPQH